MSYLSYRVIAAGRTKMNPVALKKCMKEKMNILALLDDSGSIILTKVIRENLQIDDLCNSIETSHRSKRILRIIERGVTRTKDYNVDFCEAI